MKSKPNIKEQIYSKVWTDISLIVWRQLTLQSMDSHIWDKIGLKCMGSIEPIRRTIMEDFKKTLDTPTNII